MTPDGCPVAPLARRRSVTQALDPTRDTPRLCSDLAGYEFPWDTPFPTTSEVDLRKDEI